MLKNKKRIINKTINSKQIKHFSVRLKTIKVLEENTGSKISDISHSSIFSSISPQALETKDKKTQMGLHQTKKILHSEGNQQQNEKSVY